MKNQLAIGFHYEGQSTDDQYSLFIVEKNLRKDTLIEQVKRHWLEFQNTQPDSDSEFEQYLKDAGYTIIPNTPTLLVLDA